MLFISIFEFRCKYWFIRGTIAILTTRKLNRVFSSVGLERYLDRVEVGGSNPSTPTGVPRRSGTLSFSKSELLANFYSKCAGICIGNATA